MMNIKSLFKIYVRKLLRLKSTRKPFYDFFYYDGVPHKKRALLAYRVHGIWTQSRTTWSAIGDVHDLTGALSELGYTIDIIDYDDTTFTVTRDYDLFVGHAGSNFQHITEQLPEKTVKIFFPMYPYWRFQNEEEEKRIHALEARRGVTLRAERALSFNDDYALQHADGVIVMTNVCGKRTYPNHERLFTINNASYGGDKIMDLATKDFEQAKNNFLFLSGSGNIHKGMDIALEAFAKMPDKQFYICSKLEDDFARVYERELYHTPNIHVMGHIPLYSSAFYDLMRTCNYELFLSSGEGSPGAVIDCMFQGLIPIVTPASHIDVLPHGYEIDPCTVERLTEVVQKVSAHDAAWYKERAQAIQKEATVTFSIACYRATLKKHLETIVAGSLLYRSN